MKKNAFDIATKVLQPEYEGKVKPDALKKIQTTVRRKDMSEIDEEKMLRLLFRIADFNLLLW